MKITNPSVFLKSFQFVMPSKQIILWTDRQIWRLLLGESDYAGTKWVCMETSQTQSKTVWQDLNLWLGLDSQNRYLICKVMYWVERLVPTNQCVCILFISNLLQLNYKIFLSPQFYVSIIYFKCIKICNTRMPEKRTIWLNHMSVSLWPRAT